MLLYDIGNNCAVNDLASSPVIRMHWRVTIESRATGHSALLPWFVQISNLANAKIVSNKPRGCHTLRASYDDQHVLVASTARAYSSLNHISVIGKSYASRECTIATRVPFLQWTI